MADLNILPAVLQRQAEKKADEQRRRRERKRKKTGPIEVCRPPISQSGSFRLKQGIFTTLFNDTQTLKFKIQLTVTLFTAVNHCSGFLRKQKRLAERGQKLLFVVRCDWRISIHFVGFCIFFAVSRLPP